MKCVLGAISLSLPGFARDIGAGDGGRRQILYIEHSRQTSVAERVMVHNDDIVQSLQPKTSMVRSPSHQLCDKFAHIAMKSHVL